MIDEKKPSDSSAAYAFDLINEIEQDLAVQDGFEETIKLLVALRDAVGHIIDCRDAAMDEAKRERELIAELCGLSAGPCH